uniref:Uncharacterized protein n=1 Tax=Anguilla anguilla TaxID=7936 RepID=A0A0E9PK59_ANGAN
MQPLTLNWYCVSCITQLPICSFIQSVFAGIALHCSNYMDEPSGNCFLIMVR